MCRILGIPIEVGKRSEIFNKVASLVGIGGVVCTPNPLILSDSLKNPALRRALLSADICIPDGCGLLPYLRRVDRACDICPGVELGKWLAVQGGISSLGIVGGAAGVAEAAFSALSREREGLQAAFLFDGYETSLSALCSRLRETKPEVVFVCLGSPRQEILMHSLRAFSKKTLFLGLGGSLDVYAKRVRRAPRALRALHLEWLYRMLREPRRLARLPQLLRFPLLCMNYREENNNITKNAPARTKN